MKFLALAAVIAALVAGAAVLESDWAPTYAPHVCTAWCFNRAR
jgi:hypothetical protein